MRQGSRGLLLHRHCVALAGRPRIHVAVQPSSGLRSIAMMYTKLLHSITYLMFFLRSIAMMYTKLLHSITYLMFFLRSIAMMYTKLLHSITYLMFFCVMKVADRLNSDLLSSVSTLQITVLFDHRRSHHHHFLCVFRIPFRLTWTHKVQASIPGYVRSLSTVPPHYTLSASCFLCSSCWRKFALTPFARVGTCSYVCLLQQRVRS